MTGLFTGIIGSLIGAGIQATVGGIPIREDASKALEVLRVGGLPVPPANWFSLKSSDEQRTEQVYDKIGQHLPAAMQFLGPCMEIAKALGNGAHGPQSQPATAKAWTPQEAFHKSAGYNDPATLLLPGMMAKMRECGSKDSQSCNSTSSTRSGNSLNMKNCQPEDNFCQESIERKEMKKTKRSAEILGNGLPLAEFCKPQRTANVRSEESVRNSSVNYKMLPKMNEKKIKTEPRERAKKEDKFVGISKYSKCHPSCCSSTSSKQSPKIKTERNTLKPENKFNKSDKSEVCQMCHVRIRKTTKIPLVPCGHITVCYRCSNSHKLFKCPECGMKFNSGNVVSKNNPYM